MSEKESFKEVRESPSSIEVSENAKGQYSFKVKIYFNQDKEYPDSSKEEESVVQRIDAIYKELHEKFK